MKSALLFLTILSLFLTGCSDVEEVKVIPDISFSSTIDLNNPEYSSNPFIVKKDDLGQYYLGLRGVVVYQDLGTGEYYAFDLMCTYEKSYDCLVEIVDGINVKCPCCESTYLVSTEFASKISGPATWDLKKYKTRINGDYLTIYN